VYFQEVIGYDNFRTKVPVNSSLINSNYNSLNDLLINQNIFNNDQIFYLPNKNLFYKLTISSVVSGINVAQHTFTELVGYSAATGREGMYFQYRHNSPSSNRIDPSPNNIVDLYLLTKQFSTDYISWIQDSSNTLIEPTIPTSIDLELEFGNLEKYKSISDAIIYNSAKFKPLFGSKAEPNLQATFKVVKNKNINISDNEVKSNMIAAINTYFDINNWDFGDTFYFSELSAYLHSTMAPNISSIIIVPVSANTSFGSLLQINAEFNEIITSAATVADIEIITAITSAQLNQIGVV
jgi:hypothetical protein